MFPQINDTANTMAVIINKGTVKLPGSDELNGSLTTYAKFWT
ncbi:MAG: hypothetical protein ACJASL_004942 [Paraglaciecola sp.]|jgi:hypothetical protein